MNNKSALKKWLYWFTFAIAIIGFYKLLDDYGYISAWIGNLFGILMPFLIGILIAYILYTPCRRVEKICEKSKIKFIKNKSKHIGIIVVYLIAVLIIILSIKFLIPIITQSIMDLVNNFQNYYNSLITAINELPEDSVLKSNVANDVISNIKNIDLKQYINIQKIGEYILGVLSAASGILDIFIAIIVSIYVLFDRRKIAEFINKLINALFEDKIANKVSNYFNRTNEILLKFISSQFLDAVVVGILATIAMKMLGVKYGTTLGILIGVSNLIPYFGAIVGVAVSIIITIFTGGFAKALWMGIIIIILQQIDANIINPKIVGNSLKISPLLVILAVTLGGAYFGTIGMFLAVPVAAVIKILIMDFIDYRTKKKIKSI